MDSLSAGQHFSLLDFETTAWLIAELRTDEEGQEGLGPFLEKREHGWRAGS